MINKAASWCPLKGQNILEQKAFFKPVTRIKGRIDTSKLVTKPRAKYLCVDRLLLTVTEGDNRNTPEFLFFEKFTLLEGNCMGHFF